MLIVRNYIRLSRLLIFDNCWFSNSKWQIWRHWSSHESSQWNQFQLAEMQIHYFNNNIIWSHWPFLKRRLARLRSACRCSWIALKRRSLHSCWWRNHDNGRSSSENEACIHDLYNWLFARFDVKTFSFDLSFDGSFWLIFVDLGCSRGCLYSWLVMVGWWPSCHEVGQEEARNVVSERGLGTWGCWAQCSSNHTVDLRATCQRDIQPDHDPYCQLYTVPGILVRTSYIYIYTDQNLQILGELEHRKMSRLEARKQQKEEHRHPCVFVESRTVILLMITYANWIEGFRVCLCTTATCLPITIKFWSCQNRDLQPAIEIIGVHLFLSFFSVKCCTSSISGHNQQP